MRFENRQGFEKNCDISCYEGTKKPQSDMLIVRMDLATNFRLELDFK